MTHNRWFQKPGWNQLELRAAVARSLVGRTGMLHLLPLSIAELDGAGIRLDGFASYIHHGFPPRVHDQHQRPHW